MSSSQATPNTQPVKTKSKAYSSTVAIQGDVAKYRIKYKELKKKVREIQVENDKLHLKTLRIKRNIQRMRLERAILYERMEAEAAYRGSVGVNGEDSYRASRGPLSVPPSSLAPLPATTSTAAVGSHPSYSQHSQTQQPPRYGYDRNYHPPASSHSHHHPSQHHHHHHPHSHSHSHQPHQSYYPQYESRHDSPLALPPPAPSSSTPVAADRSERHSAYRQYTPSVSPEGLRPVESSLAVANDKLRAW